MRQARTLDNRGQSQRHRLFLAAAVLQVGCGLVFAFDVVTELDAFTRDTWLELAGVIALAIGATLNLSQYRHVLKRNLKVERELDAASGAFQDVIEQHFDNWGLTKAERDVALLSIKGVSIADIAVMRNTRTGTIKAQNAAIYRKSGVSSRADLVSAMVEELIDGLHPSVSDPPRS
jgi:DNA-binding CsgD family transcriptional regulator